MELGKSCSARVTVGDYSIMSIKVNSVKCPECGADLPVEEGRTQLFCSYCGSKIIITDENKYTYHYVDDAAIKQAETDKLVKMRELDLEEKRESEGHTIRSALTIIWLILSTIVIVICIIEMSSEEGLMTGFLMLFYLGAPLVGGGAYLIFKILPEKENNRSLIRNGGIRFPKGIMPFNDKNYEVVRNALENAGFTNITCINMHDLTIGLLQKPGSVESVSVNGKAIISEGKVFMPNDPVTITYHGK